MCIRKRAAEIDGRGRVAGDRWGCPASNAAANPLTDPSSQPSHHFK